MRGRVGGLAMSALVAGCGGSNPSVKPPDEVVTVPAPSPSTDINLDEAMVARGRGLSLWAVGKSAEALRAFEEAVALDGGQAHSRVWAALAARSAGARGTADTPLRRAVAALEAEAGQAARIMRPIEAGWRTRVDDWTPDGSYFALTGVRGQGLVLMHAGSGQPVMRLPGESIALNQTGRFAATFDGRGQVSRWDLARGEVTHARDVAVELSDIYAGDKRRRIAISPTGERIAASADSTWAWDVKGSTAELGGLSREMHVLRFTASGDMLTFGKGGWRFEAGRAQPRRAGNHSWPASEEYVSALSSSPAGQLTVFATTIRKSSALETTVRVVDAPGSVVARRDVAERVSAVAVGSDGEQLAASTGEALFQWDLRAAEPPRRIELATLPGQSLRFDEAHGNLLAIDDRTAVRRVAPGGSLSPASPIRWAEVTALTWGPDGVLVVGSKAGAVYRWDLRAGSITRRALGDQAITSVALDAEGAEIIAGDAGGQVHTWIGDAPPRSKKLYDSAVPFVGISTTGLLTGTRSDGIALRDPASWEPKKTFAVAPLEKNRGEDPGFASLSSAGDVLVFHAQEPDKPRQLVSVDLVRDRVSTVPAPGWGHRPSLAQEGRMVGLSGQGSSDAAFFVWRPTEARFEVAVDAGDFRGISNYALSPDGGEVLISSYGDGLQIFDLPSARVTGQLGGEHFGRLQYDRSGEWVIGAHRHELTLWRAEDRAPLGTMMLREARSGARILTADGFVENVGEGGGDGLCRVGPWLFPADACPHLERTGLLRSAMAPRAR